MDEHINVIVGNEQHSGSAAAFPQVEPVHQSPIRNFPIKKMVFTLIGLVIVSEIIWAGIALSKSSNQHAVTNTVRTQSVVPTSAPVVQQTIISLTSITSSVKLGQNVKVDIQMKSDTQTIGTDMIITYDPKYLSIVKSVNNTGVSEGALYNVYPVNAVNEQTGEITISGVSSKTTGVVPNGLFGSINFKPKLAGNTVIKIEFDPSSTKFSNVAAIGNSKNLLTGVNNLNLEITP